MDKTVRFIRNRSPYCSGDIASFDKETANKLIELKAVEAIEDGDTNVSSNTRKGKKATRNR